ncbi:MAG: chloride channel protein [Candidatus Bipolaricaulia bacterium]
MAKGVRGQIQRLLLQNIELNLLAILIGVIGGFGAVLFRWLLFLVNDLAFHQRVSIHFLSPMEHRLGLWVILLPAAGGLLVGLITYYFAPETKGHGVPEVMEAMATKGGQIRPRVVIAKVLASGISLGSGGSAGREGPIVQIGSSAGSTLGQFLKRNTADIKVLVGCGATAGIAATFNTPIAGVLFAIELILLEFKTRSFVPLVISSVFATIVSRAFLGSQPAFPIPAYAFENASELVLYLVLGLLAGLVGVLLTESLYRTEDLFDRIKAHPVFKPVIGGLLLGALGVGFPQVFGVGYETISRILSKGIGNVGIGLLGFLLLLALVKVAALSLTLGSGGSGGIFAPSLFVGAAFGGAFGVLVNLAFPQITAPYPAYALVGMAAVFAAASRATLTSIIMLFEMTRDYNIILPLMFACVVADIVAWLLYPDTIYTKKLSRRGIRIAQELEINVLKTRLVSDVMAREVETIPQDLPLREVRDKILETGHQGFPLVDEEGKLVGIITGRDVKEAINKDKNLPAFAVAQRNLIVAYPDETLDLVWERMGQHDIGRLPVVAREDPRRLVGFLTKGDLIRFRRTAG